MVCVKKYSAYWIYIILPGAEHNQKERIVVVRCGGGGGGEPLIIIISFVWPAPSTARFLIDARCDPIHPPNPTAGVVAFFV